jgi:hypothetical protein
MKSENGWVTNNAYCKIERTSYIGRYIKNTCSQMSKLTMCLFQRVSEWGGGQEQSLDGVEREILKPFQRTSRLKNSNTLGCV